MKPLNEKQVLSNVFEIIRRSKLILNDNNIQNESEYYLAYDFNLIKAI